MFKTLWTDLVKFRWMILFMAIGIMGLATGNPGNILLLWIACLVLGLTAGLAVAAVQYLSPKFRRVLVILKVEMRLIRPAMFTEYAILTAIAVFLAGALSRNFNQRLWIILGFPIAAVRGRYWWRRYREPPQR